ncbi:MAG: hypothetical protein ACYC63_20760 [Armatimonadota bacterium]
MKIIDTIPFAKELLTPTYEESFARTDAKAGEGDVYIDETWAIAQYATDETSQLAGDHLKQFLAQSLGGDTSMCGVEKRLVLDVDADLDENPETHLIRVTADSIEVIGAGPAGVLQGVFRLEARMKERGAPILAIGEEKRVPLFKHRVHRSPLSCFYKEELTGTYEDPFNAEWLSPGMDYPAWREEDAGPDVFYHDNLLMRMAEHGFNGIWLRGSFRHFAKVSVFPEFGANSDVILSRLRGLAQRAARFGIKVFLYLNEPLGIAEHDDFFKKYPQCKGSISTYKPMVNLCTSTPEIKTYLKESSQYILTKVPELAGYVMITASEYPSHCWCRTGIDPENPDKQLGEVSTCPRCVNRTPQEVVGEVVSLIREGAVSVNPDFEIIAWNWSWRMWEEDPQIGVLKALPKETIVMGDYERGEPAEALGFPYTNDEYNIKVVGPSARFRGVADFILSENRPVYARIQIGTTHENPDIPYLPVPQKIADKYLSLPKAGVTGMMTCWNFGNMPCLGTEIAGEFNWSPQPTVEQGLRAIASRHFGESVADEVVAAWEIMSRAHDDFPGSIPVMYVGPISRGPNFPFVFDQIDRRFPNSWLLDKEIEGDHLDWASPFGPEKVLECYRSEVAKGSKAVQALDAAIAKLEGEDQRRLTIETGVMKFHLIQTTSAANVVDFLLRRNEFYAAKDKSEKLALLDRIEAICREELENAPLAIPLLQNDPRLGWHGEAYGYMINVPDIETKLESLRKLIEERLPQERAKL